MTGPDTAMVSARWSMPGVAEPPDESVVGTPGRRPGSVRRTSHLQATFPDGPAAPGSWATTTRLTGRARDLVTTGSGTSRVLEEVSLRLDLAPAREITGAESEPYDDGVADLVGISAGRGFRAAAARSFRTGSPLYFVLDDVSVVSGICGTAWSQHRPMELPVEASSTAGRSSFQRTGAGRIACSGLRPGGYHDLSWERSITFPHWVREAGDLRSDDDPLAWHLLDPPAEVCFRRRRRLDVWRSGSRLEVDAHFRDSVFAKGGLEVALHEYTVRAAVDATTDEVVAVAATANVLPFPECPWAATHLDKVKGMPASGLRTSVPETLTELEACSHLNDMLRGLADVPRLADALGD